LALKVFFFSFLQVLAEISAGGAEQRVSIKMKQGSITLYNGRNQPAVIIDSDFVAPKTQLSESEMSNYQKLLSSLDRQPTIILNDSGQEFTSLRCDQKSERKSEQ
jgi:hypothetical protein